MIENDKEFLNALSKYMESKGAKVTPYDMCDGLGCKNCILYNKGLNHVCSRNPFLEIERHEKEIELLKKEIEIMETWEKENKTLTKEELEGEKIYAEIQRLIAKNCELTKEIARLYRKLDQMEKKEKENG